MEVRRRRAVRVLLLDRDGRILLLHGLDPAVPDVSWWITPGGGLESGETDESAARRELTEEVGLTGVELGPLVAFGTVTFSFQGQRYEQEQRYYLARTDRTDVRLAVGGDADEHARILEARWWTAAELRETAETVYPGELPELLERLITAGPPVPPVGL
ncbi:NUDIX hydrolase [Kitasatospora sp. NPDC059571]|uniref:NUDIX hydrolase n=1 Tax=Kitasatospora sp. NPDC059571 TaxID=3346871 RepID=UPI00369FC79C